MTRYEECLLHVRSYVRGLMAGGCRASLIEQRVRDFVEQPGFDVTYRRQLVIDALGPAQRTTD